jgi:hypothetical protein
MYPLRLLVKKKASHSLPNFENERQRSINDFCPVITGSLSAMWP